MGGKNLTTTITTITQWTHELPLLRLRGTVVDVRHTILLETNRLNPA